MLGWNPFYTFGILALGACVLVFWLLVIGWVVGFG